MTVLVARILPILTAGVAFSAAICALGLPPLQRRAPHAESGPHLLSMRAFADLACSVVRRERRRRAGAIADDLPDATALAAVAVAAGATVSGAVDVLARRHDGPVAPFFQAARRDVDTGSRLGDALATNLRRSDALDADALRPLVTLLVDSAHYGTPLTGALERLGDDLRVHRQRRAEEKARRLPVRLLLPLIVCILPAFALLTVAPLLAGVARDALADVSIPSAPLEPLTKEPR